MARIGTSSSPPNGITQLNGDVVAIGPGISSATVVQVGGSSAASINSTVVEVTAAVSINTPNTLILRDNVTGGFFAGTVNGTKFSSSTGWTTNCEVFGLNSSTTAVNSTIFGRGNVTTFAGCTLIGVGLTPGGIDTIMIGYGTSALRGTTHVLIGNNTHYTAGGNGNMVIGNNSFLSGDATSNCTGIGNNVTVQGSSALCLGYNANSSGDNNVCVGAFSFCVTGASNATAIGTGATIFGNNSVAIGLQAISHGRDVAVGYQANTVAFSIAIGAFATTTQSGQTVIGSETCPSNSVYFGKGVSSPFASTYALFGTAGVGTDKIGGGIFLIGGASTGAGIGGSITIQACGPGTTGSSANTPATVAAFTYKGSAFTGGMSLNSVPKSANYTIDTNGFYDQQIFANTSGGVFTITLPTPTLGRMLTIIDSNNSFATNNLSIAPHGSEKIQYVAATYVAATSGLPVRLTSNGTDWFLI